MDIVERLLATPETGADPDLIFAAAKEIEQLRLAEEGAKEAFAHVVRQKRDLEAECKRLRRLLDGAYDTIRRQAPNAQVVRRGAAGGASERTEG